MNIRTLSLVFPPPRLCEEQNDEAIAQNQILRLLHYPIALLWALVHRKDYVHFLYFTDPLLMRKPALIRIFS